LSILPEDVERERYGKTTRIERDVKRHRRVLNVSAVASLDEGLEETLTLTCEAKDRNSGSIAMNHRS
jgi:hypothetical protein